MMCPSAPRAIGITRGDAVIPGTQINVPAHVAIVIGGADRDREITLAPASQATFVWTGAQVAITMTAGVMTIRAPLADAGNVRVRLGPTFVAIARGGQFSIARDGESVTVYCPRGMVDIEKTGYLAVRGVRHEAVVTDVLSATARSNAAYVPSPPWRLGTFGTTGDAESAYRQQVALARTGDPHTLEVAMANFAGVARALHHDDEARDAYREANTIADRLGDREAAGRALLGAGAVAYDEGDPAAALKAQNAALKLFESIGDRFDQANALAGIGATQAAAGQNPEALSSLQAALATFRELGDVVNERSTCDALRLHLGVACA